MGRLHCWSQHKARIGLAPDALQEARASKPRDPPNRQTDTNGESRFVLVALRVQRQALTGKAPLHHGPQDRAVLNVVVSETALSGFAAGANERWPLVGHPRPRARQGR